MYNNCGIDVGLAYMFLSISAVGGDQIELRIAPAMADNGSLYRSGGEMKLRGTFEELYAIMSQ
ncbi:MAG: hypothetical protein R3A47_03600 [Polyangiales bacterium]